MGAFTTAMIYLCIASCVFWLASKIALKVVTKRRARAEKEVKPDDGNDFGNLGSNA